MHDKQELKLFRYFLYKIEENERKKILKREELMRQDKENDNVDDWMAPSLKKGPLIDMFGPGSVFYAIRKKAKQREMEKLSYKARSDKRRGLGNGKSPRPVVVLQNKYTGQTARNTHVNHAYKSRYDVENGANDFFDEEDVDYYETLEPGSRGQIICEKGRHAHSVAKDSTPDADFDDWESSDANLCQIEDRLQSWYSNLSSGSKKMDKSVVKLHRYQAEVSNHDKNSFQYFLCK